jgi:ribosomal protein S17E
MEDAQRELESKALAIPEKAQIIVVATKTDMERADTFIKDVKSIVKEIDDTFAPLAKSAFDHHRKITGKWNELKAPLEYAVKSVTNKVRAYITEEKRKAEAEEARLRAIARQEEEERRLREAEALEKEGRQEEAAAVIEEPMTIVTPTVKPDMPKYDARTYKDPIPKAKIDPKRMGDFLKWVAASPDRWELVEVVEGKLNQKAKSLRKEIVNVIPGAIYYEC